MSAPRIDDQQLIGALAGVAAARPVATAPPPATSKRLASVLMSERTPLPFRHVKRCVGSIEFQAMPERKAAAMPEPSVPLSAKAKLDKQHYSLGAKRARDQCTTSDQAKPTKHACTARRNRTGSIRADAKSSPSGPLAEPAATAVSLEAKGALPAPPAVHEASTRAGVLDSGGADNKLEG